MHIQCPKVGSNMGRSCGLSALAQLTFCSLSCSARWSALTSPSSTWSSCLSGWLYDALVSIQLLLLLSTRPLPLTSPFSLLFTCPSSYDAVFVSHPPDVSLCYVLVLIVCCYSYISSPSSSSSCPSSFSFLYDDDSDYDFPLILITIMLCLWLVVIVWLSFSLCFVAVIIAIVVILLLLLL